MIIIYMSIVQMHALRSSRIPVLHDNMTSPTTFSAQATSPIRTVFPQPPDPLPDPHSQPNNRLRPHGLLLQAALHLLLALPVEVLLLGLGVERVELLVALGLLGALALLRALLGLAVLVRLLELLDGRLARRLDLAQHLGPEVAHLHQPVGQAQVALEDGHEVGVVVVGREAVLEVDALAGGRLVDPVGLVA